MIPMTARNLGTGDPGAFLLASITMDGGFSVRVMLAKPGSVDTIPVETHDRVRLSAPNILQGVKLRVALDYKQSCDVWYVLAVLLSTFSNYLIGS